MRPRGAQSAREVIRHGAFLFARFHARPGCASAIAALGLLAACGARQSAGGGSDHVERSFPAAGVKRVELRASAATAATVLEVAGRDIRVSGTARGGSKGHHGDDGFREVPPAKWGLTFESRRFGDLLVISTKNEVSHIHHRYTLEDLEISVPEGVPVELITRELTANGAADLTGPDGE